MQEGGSHHGVPPVPPVGTTTFADVGIPGPEQLQQPPGPTREAAAAAAPESSHPQEASGCFPDEDTVGAAGDEADRSGSVSGGNRWPREETLALIRIRSEMDAAFRDANPKGPLWGDVSRKLAELGYKRSAKKCKEKFENVHKYYKRTKDGRAGRQDGKNYRFFSQLEAFHTYSSGGAAATSTLPAAPAAAESTTPNVLPPSSSVAMVGSSASLQPTPLNAIPLPLVTSPHAVPETVAGTAAAAAGPFSYHSGRISFSFSSNNSSSAPSESEEDTEEGLPTGSLRKRKRRDGSTGGRSSRKLMCFFDGFMKQVVETQEAMQHRFLEMMEKCEQERMRREEAWRRLEVARLTREQEVMAQERAVAASRDAALVAFLQKMTGQAVPIFPAATPTVAPPPSSQQQARPAAPVPAPPPPHHEGTEADRTTTPASPMEMLPLMPDAQGVTSTEPASSRWPKPEVHALIQLRSGMECEYQEAGPKGPLWEDISAGMRQMGYNRSARRCKEKWENINKYFKKLKDSNKKRAEDGKTCPYFHQLDALYRRKTPHVAGISLGSRTMQELENSPSAAVLLPTAQPPQPLEGKNDGKSHSSNTGSRHIVSNPDGNGTPTLQVKAGNGGLLTPCFFDKGVSSDASVKKPEDVVRDLTGKERRQPHNYDKLELETDSDSMDQVDDEEHDEDQKRKMAYQIEFLHSAPGFNGTSKGAGNQSAAAAAAAAAAAGSFMATVQ